MTRVDKMASPEPAWVPPPRDGVAASRVGVGAGRFASVADFLHQRFPAVHDWPQRLAQGDVLDGHGRVLRGDSPCRPGMRLWYWRRPPPEDSIPFDIELLFQDAQLVVVDKPHFLPVTPGGRHLQQTVLVRLKRLLGINTLSPLHRLDRDTAGVLAFGVLPASRHAYQSLWRDRQVHKVYEAVAPWRPGLGLPFLCQHRLAAQPGAGFMQVRVVDGAANAMTQVELMARLAPSAGGAAAHRAAGPLALYRLTPHTGQKHQLRAQMNALGLPIVGDRIYPTLLPEPASGSTPDHALPLQLLARTLAFTDPFSGQPRQFHSRRVLALAQAGSAA